MVLRQSRRSARCGSGLMKLLEMKGPFNSQSWPLQKIYRRMPITSGWQINMLRYVGTARWSPWSKLTFAGSGRNQQQQLRQRGIDCRCCRANECTSSMGRMVRYVMRISEAIVLTNVQGSRLRKPKTPRIPCSVSQKNRLHRSSGLCHAVTW
jgi:hypothetical protein